MNTATATNVETQQEEDSIDRIINQSIEAAEDIDIDLGPDTSEFGGQQTSQTDQQSSQTTVQTQQGNQSQQGFDQVVSGIGGQNTSQQPGQQTQTPNTQTGPNINQQGQHIQQGQQNQPAQREYGERVRDDGRGNFINDAGKVVARAGAERRMYEGARRMETRAINAEQQSAVLQNDIRSMADQLATLREQVTTAQNDTSIIDNHPTLSAMRSNNLDDADMQAAIGIVSQLKTDPVSGARRVLQAAMAQGYNINQIITVDQNGQLSFPDNGLNAGTVQNMINTAVNGIQQQSNQGNGQQTATNNDEDAARQRYTAFVQSHPFADVHIQQLTQFAQQNNLTPERAYQEIRLYAINNNLDFTKPLGPQVQARQAATANTQQNGQQVNMSLPMGNGIAPGGMQNHQVNNAADDSWEDIINSSMDAAGFN